MQYTVSVRTACSRQALEDRVRAIASGGPFRVRDVAPVGAAVWALHLMPARPEMAIGFAKVAELLVLLAREFDVQAVERSPFRAVAAAS